MTPGSRVILIPSPLVLEHLQHCGVLRQDIGDQLLEPAFTRNGSEMAHQGCADALPLVFVVHREGDLGLTCSHHDVSRTADDHRMSALLQQSDQGNVAYEVDIHIEVDLLLRKATFERKEAPVKGLLACPADGGEQVGAVFRLEGADFDQASVTQSRQSPNSLWPATQPPDRPGRVKKLPQPVSLQYVPLSAEETHICTSPGATAL